MFHEHILKHLITLEPCRENQISKIKLKKGNKIKLNNLQCKLLIRIFINLYIPEMLSDCITGISLAADHNLEDERGAMYDVYCVGILI